MGSNFNNGDYILTPDSPSTASLFRDDFKCWNPQINNVDLDIVHSQKPKSPAQLQAPKLVSPPTTSSTASVHRSDHGSDHKSSSQWNAHSRGTTQSHFVRKARVKRVKQTPCPGYDQVIRSPIQWVRKPTRDTIGSIRRQSPNHY